MRAVALDDHELLDLGVVEVVAARDAGLRSRDEDLTAGPRLEELLHEAALVGDRLHLPRELGRVEVAEERRVELPGEARGEIRDHQRAAHVAELLEQRPSRPTVTVVRGGHGRAVALVGAALSSATNAATTSST